MINFADPGNANYLGSMVSQQLVIGKGHVQLKTTATPSPAHAGSTVSLSGTVSVAYATGAVTFSVGGKTLCSAAVHGGVATCRASIHASQGLVPGLGVVLGQRLVLRDDGGDPGPTGLRCRRDVGTAPASRRHLCKLPSAPGGSARLEGRDVRAVDAAVDDEARRGDERGVVAREEERRARDLLGLGEPPHRARARVAARRARGPSRTALGAAGVLTGPGHSAFTRMPSRANWTAELAAHREHPALGRGVGDLRGRRARAPRRTRRC